MYQEYTPVRRLLHLPSIDQSVARGGPDGSLRSQRFSADWRGQQQTFLCETCPRLAATLKALTDRRTDTASPAREKP